MKISASEIRVGNLLEHQSKLWRVLKKNNVKPGKGGAFVQVEMKEISSGSKLNERFRSEDKIERARVDPRAMQYLYADADSHVFMDNQTYEQISLPGEDLEDISGYLLPGIEVQVNFHNESPIGFELPPTVILTVRETESAIKGQTATGSGKPATMETGIRVTVPTFIEAGEKIKVNTDTGEYMERA